MSRRDAITLAIGDLVALLLFAVVGLASHDRGISATGLARDWLPLAIGYAAAALALHAWTRPGIVTFLQAWLLGITTGVVIRGVALDREPGAEQLQFLAVTLVVTLALLGAWRAIELVVRRRTRPAG